ncbi:ABC transporter permease [Mycobacterium deserti]|uniref:ABC transporter permease subunit n=1 Tax=Mycobacterium deserti TaxID=2978347 RepID=A0ABT2MEJ1_9MYCO|nr:ABC transporter permease subunit [Mycobacterium deserti]MCT7660692.1 ABC transporter permease subunit [Mycobacterium deserti]
MIARPPLRGLSVTLLLLALWEVLGDARSPYLPPPSTWWTALQVMHAKGLLVPAATATLQVMAISVILVIAVGTTLGALLGTSPRLERTLSPTIEVFRTIPPPTLVPLAVLLFGATTATAILLTTVTSIWAVVFNAGAAARAIPPSRFDAARSLGLSKAATVRKVVLPSLVPGVSLGLRVAAPIIMIVVLLVEMLSSLPGMGRLLMESQQNFATARVFGVLALVGALGYLLNLLVGALQECLVGTWQAAE